MLKELLRHSPLLGFYGFALGLFLVAFGLIVWRALSMRRPAIDALSRLALEGDGEREEKGPES